jgi:beta-glucosidase/6-phospho-beta-glucosidase/beta-galactosidase
MSPSSVTPSTLEPDRGFVVASGIECSAPVVAGGVRQDELRKTGHWDRYEEDLALVSAWGIRYLRYGVPYHVVDRDPAALDWAWTDRALDGVRAAGIEPIIDLLHFGIPDDLTGIGDPRLVDRFVAYVTAFAERYPWVRWYTVVNEPLVTATLSAHVGWWNERAQDDRAFVAAIDRVAACTAAGMAAIRERRPDAIFIQSDACESFTPLATDAVEHADYLSERRFVTWDLAYGRRPADSVTEWLAANGLDERRLDWFAAVGSPEGCIVGHDYYAGNEWLVEPGGRIRHAPAEDRQGYAHVAREYHRHFGMPFMLSETNWEGPAAPAWLARTWNDSLQLRLEGLPIRGYTWYGFVDHVDWDSCLRDVAGRANDCGLVDLDRRPHPVGLLYRDLAFAAARGELRPLPVDEAALAAHQSAIPAFVGELASGPTVVSGDAAV